MYLNYSYIDLIRFSWKFSVHSPATKLIENSESYLDKHLGRKA